MKRARTLLLAVGIAGLVAREALSQVTINEIRIDQPGTDNDEYFELTGPPGASLDGLTYLVIGDGAAASGVIESVIRLNGLAIPADGVFLAAKSTLTLGGGAAGADLIVSAATLNFENDDNVTHVLVSDFTGSVNQDLDADNDCILDVLPWTAIVDQVALIEEPNPPSSTECAYGPVGIGPEVPPANVSAVPDHVYRCPDASGFWHIGPADPVGGRDTPGFTNGSSPVIVTSPSSQSVCVGASVTLSVVASGAAPLAFQWQRNGVAIPGETTPSLLLTFVGLADAGSYDVVVSNACGSTTSAPAVLSVESAPTITAQPSSQTAFEGGSVVFQVVASGASPLSYQWRKDGVEIAGATSDRLAVLAASLADAGAYDVIVGNPCGSTASAIAVLTVVPAPIVTIDEIRIAGPEGASSDYFELAGAPGQSLDGLTYLVVSGAGMGRGVIEAAIDLTGFEIPADGHFLAIEDPSALPCAGSADLVGPGDGSGFPGFDSDAGVTHLLVAGFAGAIGVDLDADDDCRFDSPLGASILDAVSLVEPEGPPPHACVYASATVGPDGGSLPSHVSRCPDATGPWRLGTFAPVCAGSETPGLGNPPCILAEPESLTVCEGAAATFEVVAQGTEPLSFQWTKDGAPIPGATGGTFDIASVRLEDAGDYTARVVDVHGSAESRPATLGVEPFLSLRAGNVNAAAGAVTDVLFANDGIGAGAERRIVVLESEPFVLRIESPPAVAPERASYALYVWFSEPTKETRDTLPGGIGILAMPSPMSGRPPQPERIANTLGQTFGAERWPTRFTPTLPAPHVLLLRPQGLLRRGTFYLQGLIADPASPSGILGVTNGLVVVSE